MFYKSIYSSPLGYIEICADESAVIRAELVTDPPETYTENETTRTAKSEFEKYFSGDLQEFSFPVRIGGTDFEKEVFSAVCKIPYGTTQTFKQTAEKIGDGRAASKIGRTAANNKIIIAIPCHRLTGGIKNSLFGESSSEMVNEALINFEKNCLKKSI